MSSMVFLSLLTSGHRASRTSCSLIGGLPYPWSLLDGVLIMAPASIVTPIPPGFDEFGRCDEIADLIGILTGGTDTFEGWLLLFAILDNC